MVRLERALLGHADGVGLVLAQHGQLRGRAAALFLEYEDVLRQPEQRLAHGLDLDQVDRFLSALASACEPVDVRFQWRPQLSDPNDEMVLEAAVNGRADRLVTHNVRDFLSAGVKFGLPVVRPGEVLLELRP